MDLALVNGRVMTDRGLQDGLAVGLAEGRIASVGPAADLPAGVRRYAQGRAYQRLHLTGPGPYDAAAVRPVLTELADQLNPVQHEAAG